MLIVGSFLVGKNQINSEANTSKLAFGDRILEIPSSISLGKVYVVAQNNEQYIIEAAGYSGGPCPMGDDGTGCVGHDEKLNGFTTFRIWKNKFGIVGINPQGNTQLDSYVIYRYNPSSTSKYTYMTDQEVQMWKNIILRINP